MRKLIVTALSAIVVSSIMSSAFAHDNRYYERRVQPNAGAAIAGALLMLGGVAIIAGANQHRPTYVEPQRNDRWRRHMRDGYYHQPIPYGWAHKRSLERSGGHCGRIAMINGTWYCEVDHY